MDDGGLQIFFGMLAAWYIWEVWRARPALHKPRSWWPARNAPTIERPERAGGKKT